MHHIFTSIVQYRHLKRWILIIMRSVIQEHNIWLQHYKQTWQDEFSSYQLHIHRYHSIQTLTILNLQGNNIATRGAQHLARALQSNTVRQALSHRLQIHCYHSMQALTTLNLRGNMIDDEGAQHLSRALQSNTVRQVFFSSITYVSLLFNSDTYHTQSSG